MVKLLPLSAMVLADAHALNLKESGAKVIVGLYEGSKSWPRQKRQV